MGTNKWNEIIYLLQYNYKDIYVGYLKPLWINQTRFTWTQSKSFISVLIPSISVPKLILEYESLCCFFSFHIDLLSESTKKWNWILRIETGGKSWARLNFIRSSSTIDHCLRPAMEFTWAILLKIQTLNIAVSIGLGTVLIKWSWAVHYLWVIGYLSAHVHRHTESCLFYTTGDGLNQLLFNGKQLLSSLL